MSDPLLVDLPALLCFARVVERRSFTAAAAALGVSKSIVSTRVARLEDRLGERLLLRTSRKLAVTEAGMVAYERAARMVAAANEATRDAPHATRGVLRVNAPASFAALHMADPIARFCASHPDVAVDLVLADQLVDLVEERVDLAIRITKLEDSSLVVRKVATTALHVCASPAYLRAKGIPERPEDLLHHDCLRYSLLRDEDEWRLYGAAGRVRVPVHGRFETNQGLMLREAAIAGMGLAVLPRFMIHRALEEGQLVPVLAGYAPRPVGIYAAYVPRRVQSPRVKALVDALARAFKRPAWA